MQYIHKSSITDVKDGIIAHQVNCQDRIGAGVSGAIIRKYPEVEHGYHAYCRQCEADKTDVFGSMLIVPARENKGLKIANLFSQRYYGNAKKTGRKYTDEAVLIDCLARLCRQAHETGVYIPEYIGCGLAGGDWDYVSKQLERQSLSNLYIVTML